MSYSLLKFVKSALEKLPLKASFSFGKFLGWLFYNNNRKRWTAFRNLKAAFPQKSNQQITEIIKSCFESLGLTIVENIIAERLMDKIKINGLSNLEKDGGIMVGIHEGNWELANSALALKFPYAILVKKQKNPGVDEFLNELRRNSKLKVCYSLKELISHVHKKGYIGLMADHGAEDNALFVEFLSQLVPTPGGAAYLAKRFNKKIFPAYIFRNKDFSHQIEIGPAIDPKDKTEEEALRQVNLFFEKFLIAHPEQYLWSFKRFKQKKNRNIVILNDKKNGHLKQSTALLSLFSERLGPDNIQPKILDIEYRNSFSRVIAEILAWVVPKNYPQCLWFLFILLKKDSAKSLAETYADIVISCGNYVMPINRILSSYIGAKSITILKPNIPANKFDLCIIPAHDRVSADNIIPIDGALSYPQGIEDKAYLCRKNFNLDRSKKISLFIGGPIRDEREFFRNLKIFVQNLKNYSVDKNYNLLISTSRRTPQAIEEYLESELKGFKNVAAFVCANQQNFDFIFEGFVSLSEAVFISSESISMITETISLKKPCAVTVLETHGDKHNVFVQAIANEITVLNTPYDFKKIELKVSNIFEKNKKAVMSAIESIL